MSTTLPPTLPDSNGNSNLEAMGEKLHNLEPEKDKETDESNKPSTTSSSINGADDGPATEEKAVVEPKPVMEYPKGIEALFIMVALVLSITLCSLDQVSSTPSFS